MTRVWMHVGRLRLTALASQVTSVIGRGRHAKWAGGSSIPLNLAPTTLATCGMTLACRTPVLQMATIAEAQSVAVPQGARVAGLVSPRTRIGPLAWRLVGKRIGTVK